MKFLFKRLFSSPFLAFEILTGTFFITLLNLALPLYVILVLRKYISSGFQGTLITLSLGIIIAIILQSAFKALRTKMALAINTPANENLAQKYQQALLQAKASTVEQLPPSYLQSLPSKLQNVQNTYSGPTLTALLDAPFSLFYLLAVFLLSPILGAISTAFFVLLLALGTFNIQASQKELAHLNKRLAEHNNNLLTAVRGVDTARIFAADEHFAGKWDNELSSISYFRDRLAKKQDLHQNFSQSGSMFMSVGLYALGAPLVISGNLTVATLIGANILSSRAYQNLVRALQSGYMLKKAKRSLQDLEILNRLPIQNRHGTALSQFQGRLQAENISFTYPQSKSPVLRELSLRVDPGRIMVISGPNGSGKTTLARIMAGLLDPDQGNISADGVNLNQISFKWWRKQLVYLPEQFTFTAGSIRENISMPRPEIGDNELNQILRLTGLRSILDDMPHGLETSMTAEGREFPPGTRKRIALARALSTAGLLVIMDEPETGLDHLGRKDLYSLMNHLHGSGRTIIVFSNDPKIIKAGHVHYRLGSEQVENKPAPELIKNTNI